MPVALGSSTGRGFIVGLVLTHSPSARSPNGRTSLPSGNIARGGVTKQYACRRSEPVSPAGNAVQPRAPKEGAVTLRSARDETTSIRFMGSMREIFRFGEISPLALSSGGREGEDWAELSEIP